jgi:hypothetical protein
MLTKRHGRCSQIVFRSPSKKKRIRPGSDYSLANAAAEDAVASFHFV